jgi:short-subunit dehydrogenase
VVVTGGSQGLGEAMGVEFAKKGADVVLVSRSVEKLTIALKNVEVFTLFPHLKGRGGR